MKRITDNYSEAIRVIKSAILKSRYRAAALVNRELLSLYYGIGKYISENSRKGFWGTGAIETISERLQQELPGLRGFSAGNIKKMRIFFEQWCELTSNRALLAHDLKFPADQVDTEFRSPPANEIQLNLLSEIRPLSADEIVNPVQGTDFDTLTPIRQLPAGELTTEQIKLFFSIGFTHHYEIIAKAK